MSIKISVVVSHIVRQWYRLKRAILEVLIRYISERWIFDDFETLGDPLDTGGTAWRGFYTFRNGGRKCPGTIHGPTTYVEEYTLIGRGVFRGWWLFDVELD